MNREQSGGERRKNALFAKIKVEWRERERAKFRGKLMSRSFILSNTVLMVNWEQMFSVTWIYIYLSKIKFLERKCVFLTLSLVIFLVFD